MAKTKKRRGRPEVDSTAVQVRMLDTELTQVDAWMKRNMPEGTRPKAIRQLVEIGLASAKPTSRRNQTALALRLAAREIEQMNDQSATPAERIKRKRRLMKGPREFRQIRKD